MKQLVLNSWDVVMNSEHNPLRHLDLASQHYFMQVLGWMWSMVFSLTFLSIYQFGITWAVHLLITGAICMTVALFRESEKQQAMPSVPQQFSAASACVWRLSSEA
jgi:hypothetical protein